MQRIEWGVFLPVGRNGFMLSRHAPPYRPTFDLNRRISQLAEDVGFDYVFSMAKWRGFGGEIRFWDESLESVTLMAALAPVTRRIRLIATVTPLLVPPAVAAKTFATLDEVSGGRAGMNIVTGVSLAEYEQMGIVPDGYNQERYAHATEWIRLVKRLWREPSVTHEGRFFRLRDCVSEPKPVQVPHPFLVCAGTSDEGFEFTAREADCSFFTGNSLAEIAALGSRMRATAARLGRRVQTACLITLVLGDTDADACAELEHYRAGRDEAAIHNLLATFGARVRTSDERRAERMRNAVCFAGEPLAGGPETLAGALSSLLAGGDIDSVLLIFPDYLRDLERFRSRLRPLLEREGLMRAPEGGGAPEDERWI